VTVPLGRTVSAVAGLVGRAGTTGRTGARLTAGQAIARPGRRAAVVTAGPAGHAGMTRRLVTARAGRTTGDMTMAVAANGGGAVTTAGPGRARRAAAGRGLVTPGPPGPAAGPVLAGPVLAGPVLAGTALGPVAGRAGPGAAGLAARRPGQAGRAGRGPAARLVRPGLCPTFRRALPRTSSTRRPGRSCARCPATWPRRWPGS